MHPDEPNIDLTNVTNDDYLAIYLFIMGTQMALTAARWIASNDVISFGEKEKGKK